MNEWALPCKQFLEIDLSVVTGRVDKRLTSIVIPKAQTSPVVDIVNLSALRCSGAIQSRVPSKSPLMTRPSDTSVRQQEPKSVSRTCPSSETKTLACCGGSVESNIWLKVEYTHALYASVNNRTLFMSVEVMQPVCDSQDLNDRLRRAANARHSRSIPTDEDRHSDFAHNETHPLWVSMETQWRSCDRNLLRSRVV